MQLNSHERELLKELADTGLLEKVTDSAKVKMFARFCKETEPDKRLALGVIMDAMQALSAEARVYLNEGTLTNARSTNAA